MSDPDDKVRIAVCKVFGQLEYECASKLVGKELFIELTKRCRDVKVKIKCFFAASYKYSILINQNLYSMELDKRQSEL
jgi:hypothetical protein